MTVSELQAKRDEVLRRLDVARTQFGDRSIEYTDAKKTLELLDYEILKAGRTSGAPMSSFASFTKG